jgi:hypothetical protein
MKDRKRKSKKSTGGGGGQKTGNKTNKETHKKIPGSGTVEFQS